MNLYLLTQETNTGYDTYDSMVVQAVSKEEAKQILPNGNLNGWALPKDITVTYLGQAHEHIDPSNIICASFNAG